MCSELFGVGRLGLNCVEIFGIVLNCFGMFEFPRVVLSCVDVLGRFWIL